jgi:hypothetical protein
MYVLTGSLRLVHHREEQELRCGKPLVSTLHPLIHTSGLTGNHLHLSLPQVLNPETMLNTISRQHAEITSGQDGSFFIDDLVGPLIETLDLWLLLRVCLQCLSYIVSRF